MFENRVKRFKPTTFIRQNRYEKFYKLYSKKFPVPNPENYADTDEVKHYTDAVKEWEDAAQKRLEKTVMKLKSED